MSLDIQVRNITAVWLVDGWHEVKDFNIDAYEFSEGDRTVVGGGQVKGVPSSGAS